jgi:hypothetical protein
MLSSHKLFLADAASLIVPVLAMTIYVAKAKPKEELMADLRQEISSGRMISRLDHLKRSYNMT